MKHKPLVSVIMNGYNAARYLREAIDSVLVQTYENWEIIFWDNCSTDSTAQIANTYKDVRIKYYLSEQFTPLGEARNFAMQKAKGELIAFLDCDDIWMAEKLEQQVPLFADLEVGLVYSDAIYFNQRGNEFQLYETRTQHKGWCFRELLINYCLSIQTVIIRRAALDKLTYWFDERFNMIEEYDLFVRISEHWKLDYVDVPLAKWRMHAESQTWKKRYLTVEENKILLDVYTSTFDYNRKFPGVIDKLNIVFLLHEAKVLWGEGNNADARKILFTLCRRNRKALSMWILSFFPFSYINAIYSRVAGRVGL